MTMKKVAEEVDLATSIYIYISRTKIHFVQQLMQGSVNN
jgi:hypothetical protein